MSTESFSNGDDVVLKGWLMKMKRNPNKVRRLSMSKRNEESEITDFPSNSFQAGTGDGSR